MPTNLTYYIETVLTSVVIHVGMYLVNAHTGINITKKKIVNKVTIVTKEKENGADKLTKYGRPP